MSAANHFDVIIIGTGAGGGTLAHRLAPSGMRILLLERGTYVRREKENWSSRAVVLENRYQTRETWRTSDRRPLHPHTHYAVGGNTKFYGAALFRLRREDFDVLTHEGGVSPAWPLAYEHFEPYYAEAERLYAVHGERGEDPTEPPATAPYPHAAVSHEPRIQQLHDDLIRVGHHPFHTPLGVMLDERNAQASRCIRCTTCDGFPCLVHAKADAHVVCVDPALRHPNVRLLTDALVTRLETNPSGRVVTGVLVARGNQLERFSADIVVLSAGAVNSAAILLRSATDRHPRGLANSSDLVGRHYMSHINTVLLAVSSTPNPTVFQKTLSLNDFYFGTRAWPHPMGHVSFVGKLDATMLSAGAPRLTPPPLLDYMARHSLDFWLTSEDLPHPDNRVTLDRDGTIVLSYRPNNQLTHARLVTAVKNLLRSTGMSSVMPRHLFVRQGIPLAGVAHQNGTARFGTDPTSSVLDVHCKAHDLDNLYVVDASFFPSCGAVNPALTIMANALRVGDHLLDRLGARQPAAPHRTAA